MAETVDTTRLEQIHAEWAGFDPVGDPAVADVLYLLAEVARLKSDLAQAREVVRGYMVYLSSRGWLDDADRFVAARSALARLDAPKPDGPKRRMSDEQYWDAMADAQSY